MQSVQPKYRIGMTVAACLWLGLFPLLQGGTYAHITYDKWIIMLILTGVTLLCFLMDLILRRFRNNSAERKKAQAVIPAEAWTPGSYRVIPSEVEGSLTKPKTFPLLLAAALLLWTVLSCLLGDSGPDTWWQGSGARYEGLASQLCYFTLFALFFFSRISLKPVLLSAAAGVTAFFVIVMLQRGGGNPLGLYPAGRSYALNPEFQGTIGNVDMGTGYLLLLAGLFLHGLINAICDLRSRMKCHSERSEAKSKNPLPRTLIFIMSLSIALTLTLYLIITMDVQFGVISLAALLLFTVLRFIPKKARLPLLLLLIIAVLLVVWFWPGQSGGIWELHEILHGRGRLSFGSNRAAVWVYSLGLAKENLLLGGGSATFVTRFNQYIQDHNLVIPKEQDGTALPDYFDNPHSEYVQQLTDHGLPALLLFIALLLIAVFRRREDWFPLLAPCSAAVLCYAVQAFFSFSVCLVAPMFWVVIALSAQDNSIHNSDF